jgi:hypothetical protein
LNPYLPTIAVSLPSSTIITEKTPIPLLIVLYFLDALFVILIVWVLRHMYQQSLKKFNDRKGDNYQYGDESFDIEMNDRSPI